MSDRTSPPPRPSSLHGRLRREEGIALFVVLIVVLVLSVLIFQLSFSTKIEERISKKQKGFQELTTSLQSVCRLVERKLYEDWVNDQEEAAAAAEEAEIPGGPGGPGEGGGRGAGGEGVPPPEPEETEEPEGDEDTGVGTDSRFEEWNPPWEEQINGATVKVDITAGESLIDINPRHLFEYVKPYYPDDEGGESEGEEQGEEEEEEEEEELPGEPNSDELIEGEWFDPTLDEVEATQRMLSRLVEAIIDYNQDHGFEYERSIPNPDAVAQAITDWALERQRNEETRRIYRLGHLLELPEISWELYDGPLDPDAEDEEEEEDFGDYFGSDAGFMDQLGLRGFEEVEGGVQELPEPLGLRHVLTTYSSGKINLNTARPEVLMAILVERFEEFDEAKEVALEIDAYLNSFAEEEEGEEPPPEPDPAEGEEEIQQDFNVFTQIDDLDNVNIEWTDDIMNEDGVLARLKSALRPEIVAFRCRYFLARLEGERDGHEVEGELVLERVRDKISVLMWRELSR